MFIQGEGGDQDSGLAKEKEVTRIQVYLRRRR